MTSSDNKSKPIDREADRVEQMSKPEPSDQPIDADTLGRKETAAQNEQDARVRKTAIESGGARDKAEEGLNQDG